MPVPVCSKPFEPTYIPPLTPCSEPDYIPPWTPKRGYLDLEVDFFSSDPEEDLDSWDFVLPPAVGTRKDLCAILGPSGDVYTFQKL